MLDLFHPTVQTWFLQELGEPTRSQLEAWPAIARGEHTLLLAPTGSGKTIAAFLTAINRLMFERSSTDQVETSGDAAKKREVSVLYISPLLCIQRVADDTEQHYNLLTVAIRSGDTAPIDRRRIAKTPPGILITTPESLYLILTSKTREILSNVETIIIDEIHSLVASRRGSQFFVSWERLGDLRRRSSPQRPPVLRIGLSATQRPLDEVARLLGGLKFATQNDPVATLRAVMIVAAGRKRDLDYYHRSSRRRHVSTRRGSGKASIW